MGGGGGINSSLLPLLEFFLKGLQIFINDFKGVIYSGFEFPKSDCYNVQCNELTLFTTLCFT